MNTIRRISNMDALLFAMVLEVVLLQIRVLDGIAELCARGRKPASILDKLKREKLARNRQIIKDVVRSCIIELAESGVCPSLHKSIDLMEKEKHLIVSKRMENERLKLSRETVINELKQKRKMWSFRISKIDKKIVFLRDKIRDDLKNISARLNYADKWLCSRAESLELACQRKPLKLRRVDHEQRVHDELARVYELQIQKLEESLEYWHSRYFEDTADINERVSERRETMLAAVTRRQELQKIYDLHEGEIRSWLTFKSERAARLAREEKLRRSANNIQAWWRGVMVRRGIGAFKHLKNIKKSPTKTKKK